MPELNPVSDTCADCGMSVKWGDYHPYAACLMFKTLRDGAAVEANLVAVLRAGAAAERERVRRELLDELSRLDVEADQLVHIGEERWYSQPEMLAALNRICPPEGKE